MHTINIDDLAGNALIETVENYGVRTISFSQIHKYSKTILTDLKEREIEVIIIDNRHDTTDFMNKYNDIFAFNEIKGDILITLKDNVTTYDLRQRFRLNIALDLLPAFVSEQANASLK